MQKYLPQPDLTVFIDIAPETAVERKAVGRDRFERDRVLQVAVRESYLRLAAQPDWVRVDGERPADAVEADVAEILSSQLPR